MIKINLLKNRGGAGTMPQINAGDGEISFDLKQVSLGSGENSEQREMILKFLLVFLFPILAYAYNYYEVSSAKDELARVKASQKQKEEKLKQFGKQVEKVNQFLEDKEKINTRLNAIKQLATRRIYMVRALDTLHGMLPAKTWLTEIELQGTLITITGNCIQDVSVSAFLQNIEESIFFNNVKLVSSEQKTSKEGIIRVFTMTANMETQ